MTLKAIDTMTNNISRVTIENHTNFIAELITISIWSRTIKIVPVENLKIEKFLKEVHEPVFRIAIIYIFRGRKLCNFVKELYKFL